MVSRGFREGKFHFRMIGTRRAITRRTRYDKSMHARLPPPSTAQPKLPEMQRAIRPSCREDDPRHQPSTAVRGGVRHYALARAVSKLATAARNLVDHKRRECRWWREVAMQVWL